MSTFPPQLRFPKEVNGTIEKTLTQGSSPVYGKFLDFKCEGHIFTAILGDPNHLTPGKLYYFTAVHMIIPAYFSPVDVDAEHGTVLNESNDAFGIEINQFFALKIRTAETSSPSLNGNIQLDLGPANCGTPGNNGGGGGGDGDQGIAILSDDNGNPLPDRDLMPNNIHHLFFRFHNHYFTPIILSNGLVCYYAFEQKEVIQRWVTKLSSNRAYAAAVEYPIYLDNILRVPITKKVELLPYNPETGKFERE